MSSLARSELIEAFSAQSVEQPAAAVTATSPDRRYAVARIAGRIALVGFAVAWIWSTAGAGQAVVLVSAAALTFLIVRSLIGALPPAARFSAVTETALAGTAAFCVMVLVAATRLAVETELISIIVVALGTVVLGAAFEGWVARHRAPVRVLVVGGGPSVGEMAADFVDRPHRKWSLVGIVGTRQSREEVSAVPGSDAVNQNGYAQNGNGNAGYAQDGHEDAGLTELVLSRRADLVVLTESKGRDDALDQLLKMPTPSFRVISFDHFCEYAFGRVSVKSVSPLWFMSLLHAYGRPYHRVPKRALDITLAALVSVVFLPIILIIIALVRLSGPGPVFYRQVRVGEAGVPFEILKFRTMSEDAEADGKAAWAGENDHRVTRVGRMLRRYRLDELPQILNVLRGEMSAVGPRPERPEFVALLEQDIPHWSRRLLVKPGLTGWAQVRMGYTADLASASDKLAYDLFYLKHRGLMLDLAIALRTVRVVLQGSGAR